MTTHQFTVDEALASLNSGYDGLSQAEVDYRLDEYGPNRVAAIRGNP